MTLEEKKKVKLLENFVIDCFGDRKQKNCYEPIWKHSLRVGKECLDFISRLNLNNNILKYAGYVHDIFHDTKTSESDLIHSLSSIFNLPEDDKNIKEIVDVCRKMNRPKHVTVSDYLVALKNTNDDVLFIIKSLEMNDKLKMSVKNYTSFKDRWWYCISNSKTHLISMLDDKIKQYEDDIDKRNIFSEIKFFLEKNIEYSEENYNTIFSMNDKNEKFYRYR